MRYKKTNKTRQPSIIRPQTYTPKPRRNKQAISWHERLDRQMVEAINRDKDKP